jgi:hypothetical protein
MAIITTGNNFGATDAVTNTKLNNIANAATFDDPVDETSLEKSTSGSDSGKLRIKDAGVTTDKLATSSSKTTGVTFAKMQHISTAKVLGRASASEGDVEEAFDFKDEDDMSSNSATALASQQSIKAYVDASSADGFTPTSYTGGESVELPNGLVMKFGSITSNIPTYNVEGTITFANNFNAACLYANIIANGYTSASQANNTIESVSASNIKYKHGMNPAPTKIYWQAIGY